MSVAVLASLLFDMRKMKGSLLKQAFGKAAGDESTGGVASRLR